MNIFFYNLRWTTKFSFLSFQKNKQTKKLDTQDIIAILSEKWKYFQALISCLFWKLFLKQKLNV